MLVGVVATANAGVLYDSVVVRKGITSTTKELRRRISLEKPGYLVTASFRNGWRNQHDGRGKQKGMASPFKAADEAFWLHKDDLVDHLLYLLEKIKNLIPYHRNRIDVFWKDPGNKFF